MRTQTVALVVQKYGGTSVANIDRLRAVADRVARSYATGDRLAVVVSAMAGETNRLLGLGREMSSRAPSRELDALAATGEQVTSALLAIALAERGIRARSMLGAQAKILTDSAFTRARIRAIDGESLRRVAESGEVPVVAGFQGVDDAGNITTLGRGGSDTTAVAIAGAMRADVCEIYTDVDGVYTADPRICPDARKIPRMSYEEMLELASLGAKVLQIRSVEVAMKYGVPVHVRSSFSDAAGTVVGAEDPSFEAAVVTGVTSDHNQARITLRGIPDKPGVCARVFEPLALAGVSVDMIIQSASIDAKTDLTFTVSRGDSEAANEISSRVAKDVGARDVRLDADVVKVSIVGVGMRSHAGVAAAMFRLLAKEGINIDAISTSEIRVSCLVASRYAELAVRVLHDGYGLGSNSAPALAKNAMTESIAPSRPPINGSSSTHGKGAKGKGSDGARPSGPRGGSGKTKGTSKRSSRRSRVRGRRVGRGSGAP